MRLRINGNVVRGGAVSLASLLLCLTAAGTANAAEATGPGTVRISVSGDGTQGNDDSVDPAVSADGRTVVFVSRATNLVPGNASDGIVVLRGDETLRADLSSSGEPGNQPSREPVVSGDGRYVAFRSSATNLVPDDTNGLADIFVRDLQTGTTLRVNLSSTGEQATGEEGPGTPADLGNRLAISSDGRYVAFVSRAANLIARDTNGTADVFVRDLAAATTTRASVGHLGQQASTESRYASISADGRYVAFSSFATNLVPGDTNSRPDVFVRDLLERTTVRVNVATTGGQAESSPGTWSGLPSISGDGRSVAFVSSAANLGGVAPSADRADRVYVRNLATATTTLAGTQSTDTGRIFANRPSLSADGRYVAVVTDGTTDLPLGLFVRDLTTSALTEVTTPLAGAQRPAWWQVGATAFTADGQQIVFATDHDRLVPDDTNQKSDIFLHTLDRR